MLPNPHPAETAQRLVALAWDLRDEVLRSPQLTKHPVEPLYGHQVGDRLGDCHILGPWEPLAALFKINPILVGTRPGARARLFGSTPGLLAADFVHLLAQLSSWGLPIDPTSWVDALRPMVLTRHAITPSELRVLWFYREHHGMKVSLEISTWPENVPSSFVTANGRRISDGHGWVRSTPGLRRHPAKTAVASVTASAAGTA